MRLRDTPVGHLQVTSSRDQGASYALWRDSDGKRHKRRLGRRRSGSPAAARGAAVRRVANGPKPDATYLSPLRGPDDELQQLLAAQVSPRTRAAAPPSRR